jgi:hypothetical protein
MKRVIINLEFQGGQDTYFAMHPDGEFHYNAFATLLENNPITGVNVFMKEEEVIHHVDTRGNPTGDNSNR